MLALRYKVFTYENSLVMVLQIKAIFLFLKSYKFLFFNIANSLQIKLGGVLQKIGQKNVIKKYP